MSLITSATKTGLATYQLAISKAPVVASDFATSTARRVAVGDTLSNIKTAFTALGSNIAKVYSIDVSDTGRLEFTAAEFKNNAGVIAKISGKREFKVTGVTMADMPAMLKNKNVKDITISDSTANIQAGMGMLVSNNSRLSSITKTDATTDMTISSGNYRQGNATGGVLSKFADAFAVGKLNVKGASASDVASISADAKIETVSISDSVANIFKNATALGAAITLTKVDTISASVGKTPFISLTVAAYSQFKTDNEDLIELVTAGNANAMNGAFALTGATIANITANTNALTTDVKVKSITVSDTAANVTGATAAVLAKVTKADVTTTAALLGATSASLVTSLAGLGSKLSSVTLTAGNSIANLDVSNIKDKAKALVLAKTKGLNGDPVGLEVVNAKLADVKSLLANKQVNTAKIADTARNMLAFSADQFTMLANAKTVSFALTDNATNIGKYGAMLETAVKQFNTDRITLDIKDTVTNLTTNLEKLDKIATAITGEDAFGNSKYDNAKIKIKQIAAGSLDTADITNNIKVDYSNYSARRDVLQYIADATGDQTHVEFVTDQTSSALSIQNARNVSATLTSQQYVDSTITKLRAGTQANTAPVFAAATYTSLSAASVPDQASADAVRFNGKAKYEDVAQINIKLSGTNANKLADYEEIQTDADLMTEVTPTGAAPTYGLRIGVTLNVTA